jgi:hypothetical protein
LADGGPTASGRMEAPNAGVHRKGRSESWAAVARMTTDEMEAWLEASCERSGVAVRITDANTIGRVAAVLAPAAGRF